MRGFMSRLPFDEEPVQEDYFFGGAEETTGHKKVFALVTYDIIENKKRTRFAKYMNGFGTRVQKSCFEVVISLPSFEKMMKGIGKYCDSEDSIRVYRIQGKGQVYQWGKAGPKEEEEVIVL